VLGEVALGEVALGEVVREVVREVALGEVVEGCGEGMRERRKVGPAAKCIRMRT
jgi:hypothetical protein